MAENPTKSTALSKKLISLNKTFNTFPSTKSKEAKIKKIHESGTSLKSPADSSECLNSTRKSSLFSNKFINDKSKNDKSIDKPIDKNDKITEQDDETNVNSRNVNSTCRELNKSSSLEDGKAYKSEKSDLKADKSDSTKISKTKLIKPAKSIKTSTKSNKYTSFFTYSMTTTKSPSISTSAKTTVLKPKQATALNTISSVSTNSSLHSNSSRPSSCNSPNKSSSSKVISQSSQPKFKLSKKKTFCNEQPQQWHADSKLTAGKSPCTKKLITLNSKPKEKSLSLKSKTAKTINTFVKPIKKSSIRFENKRLTFTSPNNPKIIEDLSLDDDFIMNKRLLEEQLSANAENSPGLKVSFDEEMKIDRHRSNSDNSARISKKQNLISSLRRSIFANQDFSQSSPQTTTDRSLSLTNKSLSNRMMGMVNMISKSGKNHLAIVRSHSLESNKFSAKRVSISILCI